MLEWIPDLEHYISPCNASCAGLKIESSYHKTRLKQMPTTIKFETLSTAMDKRTRISENISVIIQNLNFQARAVYSTTFINCSTATTSTIIVIIPKYLNRITYQYLQILLSLGSCLPYLYRNKREEKCQITFKVQV